MAEYLANAVQTIQLNEPAIFTASIPCNKGYIYHADETGVFILKGITNNCFARYQVNYDANIALPEGATVVPIAIGITENGELRPTSRAIITPAAAEEYQHVSGVAVITVPKGCCFQIALRAVSGVDPTGTDVPAPAILMQNANLTITRTA